MAKDFMQTWRRASFRGAQFWVETDKVSGGRALVIHEFPHRDSPYVEDMGDNAVKFQVTAYVASDAAVQDAAALVKACRAGGAATLVLPMERHKVHCETWDRDWSRDRQGFIAFSLAFVKDGGGAAPFSAAYLSRLVVGAAGALAAPLQGRFAALFQTAGRAGYVAANAIANVRETAALLSAVRASLPMNAAKHASVARMIENLDAQADAYGASGVIADTWAPQMFLTGTDKGPAPDLAGTVSEILTTMREAATPETFMREVAPLLSYGGGLAALPDATPSRHADDVNTDAVQSTVRLAALGQWAAAASEITLTDRRQAIGIRAEVAERFDGELQTLAGSDAAAAFVALSEVRAQAVSYLGRAITDMKPVIVAEAGLSLPSLYWANHLYGDAARASELAQRNRVIHPSFMPSAIEALAT